MSDFKESRTRLVRHTFADLSDAFKAEIEWSDVVWELENGHTQDVLHRLEDPETENDFPSDVHRLRYIASILRCNSFQDLAILQGPQVRNEDWLNWDAWGDHLRGDPPGPHQQSPPTPEHVLRDLGYERHIPRNEDWLNWDVWGDYLRSDSPGPSPQSQPGPRPLSPPGPRPVSPLDNQDYADAFGTPSRYITRWSDDFASRRTTRRQ
jgi:hypothetical protein